MVVHVSKIPPLRRLRKEALVEASLVRPGLKTKPLKLPIFKVHNSPIF
jgi:hypothetical protein